MAHLRTRITTSLALLFLATSAFGQASATILLSKKASAAPISITASQSPVLNNNCPTTGNCTLSVTSTGMGHSGVVMWTTGSVSVALSSITNMAGATIPAGCQATDTGAGGTAGCAYLIAMPSGQTSLTCNWSANPGAGTGCAFYEIQCSGGTLAIDSGASAGVGKLDNSVAGTNPPGVGLTVSGSKLGFFQSIVSGFVAPTGSSFVFDGGANFNAVAHMYNVSSGTAPTWTSSTSQTSAASGLALKCS